MTELLALEWAQRIGLVVGGLLLGILVERIVGRRLVSLAKATRFKWDDVAATAVHGLGPIWFTAGGVYIAATIGTLPQIVLSGVRNGLMIVLIFCPHQKRLSCYPFTIHILYGILNYLIGSLN